MGENFNGVEASPRSCSMKFLVRSSQVALLCALPMMIAAGGSGGIHIQTIFILIVAFAGVVYAISAKRRIEPPIYGFSWALGVGSFLLLLTMLPLPIDWLSWISPGQAALTSNLFDSFASDRDSFTLSGAPLATRQALVSTLLFAGVFQLSWRWCHETEFRRLLPLALIFVGLLVSVVGMARFLLGNAWWEQLAIAHHGHFPPFHNRNHFALFTSMICLVSLGAWLRSIHVRFRWSFSKLAVITGFFGISIFCAAASLGSGSKGGLVSLVAGLTIVGFIWYWQTRSADRLILILFGFALLLVLMFNFGRETLLRFEDWLSYTGSDSRDARLVLWADSLSMFRQHPITGIGAGAFEYVFPSYQSRFGHKTFTHAENDYLQLLAELGVPGVILIAFLLFALFNRFTRALKKPMTPVAMGAWGAIFSMLCHGFYDFPFHIGSLAFVFFLLLGFVLVPPSGPATENREPIQFGTKASFFFLSALLVCLLFFQIAPADISSKRVKEEFDSASSRGQGISIILKNWPYYWRARELAAYRLMALPDISLDEPQEFLRSAQTLFPENPLISRHASFLFWNRSPEVAMDFLETACMLTDAPASTMVTVLDKLIQKPSDVPWMLPLSLSNREFWQRGWDVIHSRGLSEFATIFAEEGMRRWLRDPVERASASETMVRFGHATAVVETFRINPPTGAREHYWLAEAYRAMANYGFAAKHFRQAYDARALPEINLPPAVSEAYLVEKAELDQKDINLQLEAGTTLFHLGEFGTSIPFLKRVVDARPYYRPAILALALSYEKMGMEKAAMEQWRFLAGTPENLKASSLAKQTPLDGQIED
jgi:O-antigen ligase